MLVKKIKYTDYNGVEREEEFLFSLNKAEIFDLQFGTEGGYDVYMKKIVDTKDVPKLVKLFKELILGAYGEKSADGRQFIKSKELSTWFSQTEAYSNLLMELVSDEKAASDFMIAVMPADVQNQISEEERSKLVNNENK